MLFVFKNVFQQPPTNIKSVNPDNFRSSRQPPETLLAIVLGKVAGAIVNSRFSWRRVQPRHRRATAAAVGIVAATVVLSLGVWLVVCECLLFV